MGFATKYLDKQDTTFFKQVDINTKATPLVIVIPCYNEPDIDNTIQSVVSCYQPNSTVTLLVVVNHSEIASEAIKTQNEQTYNHIKTSKKKLPDWLTLETLFIPNLPKKHAGVGWARKIGMDWAIALFNSHNIENGLIISLDADSLVAPNYLVEVEQHFDRHQSVAATIYFEHPLESTNTSDAIVLYELYMRYYKNALNYVGFPFSVYTIGSCFAVTAKAYVAQGGMNRKKAGEDFYFLQKLMPIGKVNEIRTTTVFPSARISDRVPFGTGPVLKAYQQGDRDLQICYPLEAILVLKDFFRKLELFYSSKSKLKLEDLNSDHTFVSYCHESNLLSEIVELTNNCSCFSVFEKRFFHVFNAFRILKWLNYALVNGYPKKSLVEEAANLLESINPKDNKIPNDPKLMLKVFRDIDKAQSFI